MIVCLCANISERRLDAMIADGATTLKEIERRCSAGAACGACRPLIRDILKRRREEEMAEAAPEHVRPPTAEVISA